MWSERSGRAWTGLAAVAVVAVAAAGAACASVQRTTTGGMSPGRTLGPDANILVVPVEDAVEIKSGLARGTGVALTDALRDGLVSHGFAVRVAAGYELAGATAEAKDLGFHYVLRAFVTEWVDKPTNWTRVRDSAGLSVELYAVETGAVVGSASCRLVGTTAEAPSVRFVPELADATLARIFGWLPAVLTRR
ncbi:MAG TPA: DUF4823 domain-containing protein [Myxococcota bacterium]|nr:DUF4823 domain-containing protein [Myxococcota bacterium]